MNHPSSSPRMVVRGVLALELVPGTRPEHVALIQTAASALAEYVGHDLAVLAPAVREMDLVLAACHYDPAEVLRPNWPLHRQLQELHARAPHAEAARVVVFGADTHGVVPQPLRAEPGLYGGPLRVIPFLLVGQAEIVTALAAQLEEVLLDRGMTNAATALHVQDAFFAQIEHARYLTAYDLAAMMAMQYRNVGLGALWTVIETALLAPDRSAWLDASPEPLLHYQAGQVRIADFDRAGWQWHYAPDSHDEARLGHSFELFQARQRQLASILHVHGLDIRPVRCTGAIDARELLA